MVRGLYFVSQESTFMSFIWIHLVVFFRGKHKNVLVTCTYFKKSPVKTIPMKFLDNHQEAKEDIW